MTYTLFHSVLLVAAIGPASLPPEAPSRILFLRIGRDDLDPCFGAKPPTATEHHLAAIREARGALEEMGAKMERIGPHKGRERSLAVVVPEGLTKEEVRRKLESKRFSVQALLVTGVHLPPEVANARGGPYFTEYGPVRDINWDEERGIVFVLHLPEGNPETIARIPPKHAGKIARESIVLEVVSGDVGLQGSRIVPALKNVPGLRNVKVEGNGERIAFELEIRALEEMRVRPGTHERAARAGWGSWCWSVSRNPVVERLREKGVEVREVRNAPK